LVTAASVRIGGFGVAAALLLATRTADAPRIGPRDAARILRIGLFDSTANVLFAAANTRGELEVVSVLGSLYPAVTTLLAVVLLHERLGRLQLAGVALALTGVVLLAGG
jgi:drug/metabolite transporter (DMT)-like permease